MSLLRPVPRLNAICAYFTMFPFAFPSSVLSRIGMVGGTVLDPFCGRGTTNIAARAAGVSTVGIDSNPVAVAIAKAKLVHADPDEIVKVARDILKTRGEPVRLPQGEFWDLAYHPHVLRQICALRESLIEECQSDERIALRAIVLGALHGPRNKGIPAYFSNQAPRTFAPKPAYAVRFWSTRGLTPLSVDVIDIIARRANRYYGQGLPTTEGDIRLGDSRNSATFAEMDADVGLVVTSPPYYGMRTYIPDQWLRWWFLGGPDTVDYSKRNQLGHTSPPEFASELRAVWQNVAQVTRPNARMVIRFGAINDRKIDPCDLIELSLRDSGWHLRSVAAAGSAQSGKRQASHFVRAASALEEYDFVAEPGL